MRVPTAPYRDLAYLAPCVLASSALACRLSSRFGPITLGARMAVGLCYFAVAAACAAAYAAACPGRRQDGALWSTAMLGSGLMVLASSAAATWVQQTLCVLVPASLMSVPGAAAGASMSLALLCRRPGGAPSGEGPRPPAGTTPVPQKGK